MNIVADEVLSFDVSENQKMIAQMVRDFGEKEIKPHMMKWDESQEFPVDLFRKMGGLGLMGVSPFWQILIIGLVIIGAVGLDTWTSKQKIS